MKNKLNYSLLINYKHHVLTLLFIAMIPSMSFSQSAQEIFLESIDNTDPENIEMITTLVIEDANKRQRIRKIASSRKKFGTSQKMILKFIEPPDVRGTSMLVFDHADLTDEMWIYMPAIQKVRRIISADKGKNFMGSEFSNADMSKPNFEDFQFSKLANEVLDGRDCYKLELVCKNPKTSKEMGYNRQEIWISKSDMLSRKIIYFDKHNKPKKKQTLENYKMMGKDKFFAYNRVMENLKNHRTSYMNVVKIQSGSQLAESEFRPEQLSKP